MRPPARVSCAVALALVAWGCGPKAVAPTPLLGVWHEVAPGETTASIAGAHGADPAAVAELNDLPESGAITDRREVFVPLEKGGEPPGTGAAAVTSGTKPGTAGSGGGDRKSVV
jgi:hypothetical protein